MIARISIMLLCGAFLVLSDVQAKGSDGVALLKGTIRGANISAETVSFSFTGKLSFSFFTARHDDPSRKQINLKLDVRELPVQIPKFGNDRDCKSGNFGPFCVSFENAAKYAREAATSGEIVDVALFGPVLSYDIGGLIKSLACTHAHVVPKNYHLKDFDIGDLGASNARFAFALYARSTRKDDVPLLGARAGR